MGHGKSLDFGGNPDHISLRYRVGLGYSGAPALPRMGDVLSGVYLFIYLFIYL